MPRRVRDDLLAQRRFRHILMALVAVSLAVGILIVPIEKNVGMIQDYEDGLWWTITTISSVGYGDVVPVTTLGRFVGAILQVLGFVMLSVLLGMVTFAINKKQETIYWAREFERFNQLERRLSEIEKQLQYLVRSEAERTGDLPTEDAKKEA
ncbi:potassium channel family protein [Candidatus Woesebacteria bacterium]|nr:potassium channel family protein [Candidatus Woesebacteria bacterium]MCD8507413.1 potassium channel family protein [Candidatus Woesebacteria bacterium]MCD8527352.1 potassium channel family protein [Candidatus Woesebacteria bacterium]MCD8546099.1 potassium channel family protein [Candidatus Woesebacteria bacterium]